MPVTLSPSNNYPDAHPLYMARAGDVVEFNGDRMRVMDWKDMFTLVSEEWDKAGYVPLYSFDGNRFNILHRDTRVITKVNAHIEFTKG